MFFLLTFSFTVQPRLHLAGRPPRLAVDGVRAAALAGVLVAVQLRALRGAVDGHCHCGCVYLLCGRVPRV